MEQLKAIEAVCKTQRMLIDEYERLGLALPAALASQALDAADKERESRSILVNAR